ncbi:MAG: Gldg family protein [Alphaproteobacteria bacterium]|nr:Gldg family protein [Alphaproteobacteria bacterium]MCB9931131.1 Gldg family protein [Alphaproteobacteria bacterium]
MADPAQNPVRQRNLLSVLGLIVIAALFVAVVVLSNQLFRSSQVDLTEDGLYTLSKGTKEVLQGIDEPITLRFYYSSRIAEELPDIGVYAQRVRDMLEEYARIAGGKVRLEIHDPQPFTDEEDLAVAVGLQGVPIDQGGDLVYFGLAGTNSTDQQQIIPFFDQKREAFLEYDLTRLVYNLAHPKKPVAAVISGLPVSGSPYAKSVPGAPDDSWAVWGQLKELFDVRELPMTNAVIPDDANLLLLIHPDKIDDRTRYAIDQFALKGGRVVVLIDPHSEVQASDPQMRRGPSPNIVAASNLPKLLKAWGLEMPPGDVIGDAKLARRVQVPTQGPVKTRVAAIDYPLWLALGPEEMSQQDLVTSQLSLLNLASPGHLDPEKGATTTFTPLLWTSAEGGKGDLSLAQQGSTQILEQTNTFKPDGKYTLAARIRGPVKSAFPDGPPKPPMIDQLEKAIANAKEGEDTAKKKAELDAETKKWDAAKAAHIAESKAPLNAIVVADVDFLADGLWVRVQDFFGKKIAAPYADNGNLLVNATENLSGSDALISLRSRGVFQRPFTYIQAIQRKAEQDFRQKEQELVRELNQAEASLKKLQTQVKGDSGVVLSQQQKDEIARFREKAVGLRRELRDVQYKLRKDVEQVTDWVKLINIAAVPVLVAVFALVLALVRRNMRRHANRAA